MFKNMNNKYISKGASFSYFFNRNMEKSVRCGLALLRQEVATTTVS
jgi:hypothetical protein